MPGFEFGVLVMWTYGKSFWRPRLRSTKTMWDDCVQVHRFANSAFKPWDPAQLAGWSSRRHLNELCIWIWSWKKLQIARCNWKTGFIERSRNEIGFSKRRAIAEMPIVNAPVIERSRNERLRSVSREAWGVRIDSNWRSQTAFQWLSNRNRSGILIWSLKTSGRF